MAGQLAHICLVNSICQSASIDEVPNLMPSLRTALLNYTHFCRLGAVSPDCPSLMGESDSSGWNKLMHYHRPTDFVRFGYQAILPMIFTTHEARIRLAWLFGYLAHLVSDYTIHPVVAALVGPYAVKANQKFHRRCELEQDAYIFHKLTGNEIFDVDFLEFSQLDQCGVNGNIRKINPEIVGLWKHSLQQYPSAEIRKWVRLPKQSLLPDRWVATYLNIMERFATKDKAVMRLANFNYHRVDKLETKYLVNLPTPNPQETISYDDLFERARHNIVDAWGKLANAFVQDDIGLFDIPNADLDSGKDADDKFLYWS